MGLTRASHGAAAGHRSRRRHAGRGRVLRHPRRVDPNPNSNPGKKNRENTMVLYCLKLLTT